MNRRTVVFVLVAAMVIAIFVFIGYMFSDDHKNAELSSQGADQRSDQNSDSQEVNMAVSQRREFYREIQASVDEDFQSTEPVLKRGLSDPDSEVRMYAVGAYYMLFLTKQPGWKSLVRDSEFRNELMRLVVDESYPVRMVTLDLLRLGFKTDREIIDAVLAAAPSEPEDLVKHSMVTYLATRIEDEKVQEVFMSLLASNGVVYEDKTRGSVKEVAYLLSTQKGFPDVVIPKLLEMLVSEEYFGDETLLYALVNYGKILKSYDRQVRSMLARLDNHLHMPKMRHKQHAVETIFNILNGQV